MIDNISTGGAYYSIDEYNSGPPQILAFPNPCTDQLTIKMLQPDKAFERVNIFSFDGRLLRKIASNSNQTTIDVHDLENGYYLFQTIDKEGETFSGKFLKN
jgi:hypothetical protein